MVNSFTLAFALARPVFQSVGVMPTILKAAGHPRFNALGPQSKGCGPRRWAGISRRTYAHAGVQASSGAWA